MQESSVGSQALRDCDTAATLLNSPMSAPNRLFLLDGMALVYRAHFAFIRNPIRTSKGVNTSAIFGFATTLLDLLEKQKPTHLGLVFDTDQPTFRHEEFPAYKAQRDEMPEELSAAIPLVRKFAEAFRIPVLTADGWEADDIIGTLARRAEATGDFEVFMVTPDKDFAQLVTEKIRIYKPGRQGGEVEILGPEEIRAQWEVQNPLHVIDVLGLWGDASDNIPGVPGVGEKTAKKLISTYGSVEGVLENLGDLKGKQKEAFETHRDQALLCKRLATIATDAPIDVSWEQLLVEEPDKEALAPLLIELEFNALGRRVLGEGFKAGRGQPAPVAAPTEGMATDASGQGMLLGFDVAPDGHVGPEGARLRTLDAATVAYHLVDTEAACHELAAKLAGAERFCFDTETTALDARDAALVGLSFCLKPGEAWFVAVPEDAKVAREVLDIFRPIFEREGVLKIGQNLKYDLGVLLAHGIDVAGPFHDTMLAHGLTHPDQRHSMDYMAESLLGYSPVSITTLLGEKGPGQRNMRQAFAERPIDVCRYACEDADITMQLHELLDAELKRQGLDGVFREIEAPLLPVLVRMEAEGIRVDTDRLRAIGRELQDLAVALQDRVIEAAGQPFNLNSPRQLGEILFEKLKLIEKPKKTKTGQYVTNEQVLAELAPRHAIVRDLLEYREAVKLKGTYVDTLPGYVHPRTGRVHTHFHQLVAATGRLASSDPNLQNIPVRTELGRGIRDAFVARDENHLLLSADYSQIELRVMAALSADPALIEAFARDLDIHTATAARVYGVDVSAVDGEMRRRAKMVNFGIIYGISAFGLAQRLGIPRGEADSIIKSYFEQYPGVKEFMDRVVREATEKGYVETMTGRRRHLPDLRSANQNIRSSAERVAINTPIQGTAADMIKLAMIRVDTAIREAGLKSRLLLQVHDELVLDMTVEEEEKLVPLVRHAMTTALPLPGVEVTVGIGKGRTWLEAH